MTDRWVKSYTGILDSSLMVHGGGCAWFFHVCLYMARDQDWEGGTFRGHHVALAARAGLEPDDVKRYLDILTSPDEESTSPDEGGRRLVEEGPNRYRVVNWPKYQDSPLRKKWREDKRRQRTGGGQEVDNGGQPEDTKRTKVDSPSVSVSVSSSSTAMSTKGGVGGKKTGKKKTNAAPAYTPAFVEFWKQTWGRGNKKAALAAWEAIEDEDMNAIVVAACEWKAAFERRPADKRPHVSTWLNARGWEDDLGAELAKAKGDERQVGKHIKETINEEEGKKRRSKVRQAILEHTMHLMELEVDDPDVALIVQNGIDELKKLHKLPCESDDAKELIEGFQEITDRMLLQIAKGWDEGLRAEWKKAAIENGKTPDAQKRMYEALARRAVTKGMEIKPITDYDWMG